MKWEMQTWYITIDGDIFKVLEVKDFEVSILTKQNNKFVVSKYSKGRLDYIFSDGLGIANSYKFDNGTEEENYKKVAKNVQHDVYKSRR